MALALSRVRIVQKLNAVKHGMRAAILVLLDDDAQALDRRKDTHGAARPELSRNFLTCHGP